MASVRAIGLCIPLLAIVCALGTGGAALVTGVTGDTVRVLALMSSIPQVGDFVDCTP